MGFFFNKTSTLHTPSGARLYETLPLHLSLLPHNALRLCRVTEGARILHTVAEAVPAASHGVPTAHIFHLTDP